jgi:hypothetical protein
MNDASPVGQSPSSGRPAAGDTDGHEAAAGKSHAAARHDSAGHEREPIFENWPNPRFALFITGQQSGYLEPCGCTGLTNQKGGLARRHTLYRQLSERGWPLVAVDVGNQVRRLGRQSEIKFQVATDALKKIGYQAVALGVEDLRLSFNGLGVTLAAEGSSTPFVSANAAVLDRAMTPAYHIVKAGGKTIGVTAVLGKSLQDRIISGEIVMTTPEAGLDAVMPKLREARCDLLVLLAHASIAESEELGRKYPDFHVVVTAGGTGDPAWQPEPVSDTKSLIVQVGTKGMFVGVLGFYDDPEQPWRYQRVPLDARFGDSPEMLAELASYQKQLETEGLERLGLTPLPHPTEREYVGSEKCGECHTKAYEVWKTTPHAHATESLVHPPERGEIARHFDPECLSCHVTGWDPQKIFPYASGYLSLDKTPHLTGSGCENCHGPGGAHVAAQESGAEESELLRLQAGMRLRLSEAEKKCLECHDLDNSPDFHAEGAFETYWDQVKHKGLD